MGELWWVEAYGELTIAERNPSGTFFVPGNEVDHFAVNYGDPLPRESQPIVRPIAPVGPAPVEVTVRSKVKDNAWPSPTPIALEADLVKTRMATQIHKLEAWLAETAPLAFSMPVRDIPSSDLPAIGRISSKDLGAVLVWRAPQPERTVNGIQCAAVPGRLLLSVEGALDPIPVAELPVTILIHVLELELEERIDGGGLLGSFQRRAEAQLRAIRKANLQKLIDRVRAIVEPPPPKSRE